MKIAVWYNLPSGGSKRALHQHVQGLVSRGHTVEIWCPPSADRTYLPLNGVARENVVPLDWREGRRTGDLLRRVSRFEANLKEMKRHSEECARQIGIGKFDLLFANTCRYFGAPFIGRYSQIPSVLYLGEPCRSLYEAAPVFRWSAPRPGGTAVSFKALNAAILDARGIHNARIQVREETENAAAFGRILVNSLFSRETVLRSYGLDSRVCYLGIDTSRFQDLQLSREGFVIGLGSFQPAKNIRLAIEAVSLIKFKRPKLVWIGNSTSSYLAEMIDLAGSLDVDFIPMINVKDEVLWDTLNRASVMIYAPRLEPFGLAPLEAIACGVPVVGVAEGGVRETIVDGVNGLLVDSSPESVAEAVKRLLEDQVLARRLGNEGREKVHQAWSVHGAVERLEANLLEVLSRGKHLTSTAATHSR